MRLLQAPRLVAHVAGGGLEPSAHFPSHCSWSSRRRAGAALEPFGDQPSGLACDFLNVAPQLIAGLGQAFK